LPRSFSSIPILLLLLFLPLKALQTRPSLDQRPVHREVFVTEQIPFPCLLQYFLEKPS